MLDEQHGRPVRFYRLLYLHARNDVHVIERLVPDIQIGALAQTQRQQRLFLLPRAPRLGARAEAAHIQSQPVQHAAHRRGIEAARRRQVGYRTGKPIRALRHVRNGKPRRDGQRPFVSDAVARHEAQKTALAAAVAAPYPQPVAALDFEVGRSSRHPTAVQRA